MSIGVPEETENTIGNTRFNTSKYAIHRQIEDSQDEQFSKDRQHPCYIAMLPSHTASMNVGVVVASGTSGNHRHYYEGLIYIIIANGYSVVEGNKVGCKSGDIIYAPPWSWHQHLIQALIKRYDTSPAQTHHYCKVLEILIAGKKQSNKDRYTASSSRLI